MTHEHRWARAKALFQAAVDLPAAERAAFVESATENDPDVRRDVQSLLAADTERSMFAAPLDAIHAVDVADAFSTSGGGIAPLVGGTVGIYEVIGTLGAGGMGEVYRARDPNLNRDVAIKVLPDTLALDPASLGNFRREAQMLASLNHQNIGAIYGFEEAGGIHALILELVEGETLADRIGSGPVPVRDVLTIADQVAAGLETAHECGIVHRDLKPSNVTLTASGAVKVLDFGLAQRVCDADARRSSTRAIATTGGPAAEGLFGSPSYMSPEQVRGDPVDGRTDVWAFGCLLFELLTGRRAFSGTSIAETLTNIEQGEPDWTALPASLPPFLGDLVRHCLQKDAVDRPATFTDIRRALLRPHHVGRMPSFVVAAVAAVGLLAIAGTAILLRARAQDQWAHNVAIPQLEQLVNGDEYAKAFTLATQIERVAPNDPTLMALWPRFSAAISLATDPAGADAFVRPYGGRDDAWQGVGRTPLARVRLPMGVFELRLVRDGYEPQTIAAPNPSTLLGNATNRLSSPVLLRMLPKGAVRGMISVPGGAFPVSLNAFSTTDPVPLDPFLIDEYEVTNQDYQAFVDAGGYRRADVWQNVPLEGGDTSGGWKDTVEAFRDTTGAFGPATWGSGHYAAGTARRPVAGVSWFEAVAYCQYAGKALPTLYHWRRAALSPDEMFSPLAPSLIAHSNFSGNGPADVGAFGGIGPYGTYDMAGNVREWSWNEAQPGSRWMQGGAWNQPTYMPVVVDSAPAMDRSPINGFRCARYSTATVPDRLTRPVRQPSRQPRPPSAPVPPLFDAFRQQYQPIRAPLNQRVDFIDRSHPDWTRERISFDAGYEDGRAAAYLFIPKGARPPYQVVLYFPGRSSFVGRASSEGLQPEFLDFAVRNGRALVWPIYKGSYERWIPTAAPSLDQQHLLFDWRQDIARVLDVLATRDDIDTSRVAYLGLSYGASVPVSILALEGRFKAAVLMSSALGGVPGFPDPDALDYAAHITLPVLMLSGRDDFVFPLETVAKPMFAKLGTPAGRKRHVVFDAGHMMFPRGPMTREVLAWLDRYLGPARKF